MVYWNSYRIKDIKNERDLLIAQFQTEVLGLYPNTIQGIDKLNNSNGLFAKMTELVNSWSLTWLSNSTQDNPDFSNTWSILGETLNKVKEYKNTIITSNNWNSGWTPEPSDTIPDQFIFIDVNNVTPSSIVESNEITISWIDWPSPISITGGEYSINGWAYTSTPWTITNWQKVKVRHTTWIAYLATTNTTLTIGGVSDTFSSVADISVLWSISVWSSWSDTYGWFVIDSNGNAYQAAIFSQWAFDLKNWTTYTPSWYGANSIVYKYNTSWNILWSKKYWTSWESVFLDDIDVDSLNNLYVWVTSSSSSGMILKLYKYDSNWNELFNKTLSWASRISSINVNNWNVNVLTNKVWNSLNIYKYDLSGNLLNQYNISYTWMLNYYKILKTDSSWNYYIYWNFESSSITIWWLTLNRVSWNSDLFLLKINSSWTLQWLKWFLNAWGSDGYEAFYSDAWNNNVMKIYNDNIYITWNFTSSLTLGSTTYTSSWSIDTFIAKLDSSGNVINSNKIGWTGEEFWMWVYVSSNNIYLCWSYSNWARFWNEVKSSNWWYDSYISVLDTNFNFLWTKTFWGSGMDYLFWVWIYNNKTYISWIFESNTINIWWTTLTNAYWGAHNDIFHVIYK